MSETQTKTTTTDSLARGAAYGLIALGFRYPDRNWVRGLREPACWDSWPDVIRALDGEVASTLDQLRAKTETVAVAAGDEDTVEPVELQSAFVELFGHTVRGKCPPYELEYGRSEIIQRASELADVTGFYCAFELEYENQNSDRPDHVAIECEFLSVLCAKEAHGESIGDEELIDRVRQAHRSFLKDHLGRWLPALTTRVTESDPEGWHGALARFATAFVSAECRRLDVPFGPALLDLRPIDESSESTIDCGTPDHTEMTGGRHLVQLGIDGLRAGSGTEA